MLVSNHHHQNNPVLPPHSAGSERVSGPSLTLAVGALLRAFASRRRALSYSLFSDSSLTAASQISSLFGLAYGGGGGEKSVRNRGWYVDNQRLNRRRRRRHLEGESQDASGGGHVLGQPLGLGPHQPQDLRFGTVSHGPLEEGLQRLPERRKQRVGRLEDASGVLPADGWRANPNPLSSGSRRLTWCRCSSQSRRL